MSSPSTRQPLIASQLSQRRPLPPVMHTYLVWRCSGLVVSEYQILSQSPALTVTAPVLPQITNDHILPSILL